MLALMSNPERRANERVAIPGKLRCEVLVYQPLHVTDISLGGALVETTFPLPVNSSHDIRVPLGSTSVMATARVVHSRVSQIEGGRLTYESGIEFVDPSSALLAAIRALLPRLLDTTWD